MSEHDEQWERKVLIKLAESGVREQRRARRWGIFFKLLTFVYITAVLVLYTDPQLTQSARMTEKHTALVELNGIIADGGEASADNIVTALRDAFEDENTAGVILRINSPGGTPVQAGYIYDEIKRLKQKHADTPVYAVITDVCASGGYYVASATDRIGVRMDNFGFVEAMKKLGVERRTLTAGENKALLDPFLPVDEATRRHMQGMLEDIHRQFIDAVKQGRGDRLKNDVDGLFSGLIWTGQQSLELGLVDELGSASYVAREVIGEETIIEYAVTEDLLERLAGRVGASMARVLHRQLSVPLLR